MQTPKSKKYFFIKTSTLYGCVHAQRFTENEKKLKKKVTVTHTCLGDCHPLIYHKFRVIIILWI